MNCRLIAFDCDKTLLNDAGEVTPLTREAILDASRRGAQIVFASGRAPQGIRNVIRQLDPRLHFDYFICFNGGLVVTEKGEQLSECHLDGAALTELRAAARQADTGWYAFTDQGIVLEAPNPHAEIEAAKNDAAVLPLDPAAPPQCVYKFIFADELEKLDRMEAALARTCGERYAVIRSEPHNLEVVPRQAGKGSALAALARQLGIAPREVAAFGDADNDLTMLRFAGIAVAMGNATPAARAAADIVTADNNHDGIASALQTLFAR